MARCNLPARQCLWEHIRARVLAAGLKPSEVRGKPSLSLLCPNHADRKRSLTISAADIEHKRIVVCCHAGCPEMAVRDALVRRARIDPACLPVSQADAAALLDAVVAELTEPTKDHGQKLVIALAVALGYKEMPRGGELEGLAARAGVGRRSAYKVRGRHPDNS